MIEVSLAESQLRNVGDKQRKRSGSLLHRFGKGLVGTFREFCLETSIHGFNHIAVPNRYFIERLMWITATALAVYMVVNISRDQLVRYNENPTVVTLEKDFRNWKFPLPAITECASNRNYPSKAEEMIKKLWNLGPKDEEYPYYMKFVDTVANSDLMHLEGFEEFAQDQTLDVDLYQLAVGVMPEQVVKPTWAENHNPKWIPVMTESGICYSTNSLAVADIVLRKADKNETTSYPVNCKYASFSCYMTLEVSRCVRFYFHSPYDVADIGSWPPELCSLVNRNLAYSVMESVCGPGVRDLRVKRRRCLYTDEPTNTYTEVYSMNMCRRSCRNKFSLKMCGCRPFYNFYEEGQPCSPAGMACLAKYKEMFKTLECPCTPQCVDAVYQELSLEESVWDKGVFLSRGSVRLTLQAPRERYNREIVFHFQDLVVSFGGAAGFFLGASFLSFVEILYFIIEKIFKCLSKSKKTNTALAVNLTQRKPQLQGTLEERRIKELTYFLDNDWMGDRK